MRTISWGNLLFILTIVCVRNILIVTKSNQSPLPTLSIYASMLEPVKHKNA